MYRENLTNAGWLARLRSHFVVIIILSPMWETHKSVVNVNAEISIAHGCD